MLFVFSIFLNITKDKKWGIYFIYKQKKEEFKKNNNR
jgi:hypothetical protein